MESFEMEKKDSVKSTKTSSFASRKYLVLHIVMTFLVAVSTGLISYNVYQVKSIFTPERDQTLSEKYPGYFRSEELQNEYNKTIGKFDLPLNLTLVWHNGCCISSTSFISPPTEKDMVNNKTRTLAKDGSKKQYFMVEKCLPLNDPNCPACNCLQEEVIYTAVYTETDPKRNNQRYGIFRFKSPSGCCKCAN